MEWGLEPIEGAMDAGMLDITTAAETDALQGLDRICLRLAAFYSRNYCRLLFVIIFSLSCLRQSDGHRDTFPNCKEIATKWRP